MFVVTITIFCCNNRYIVILRCTRTKNRIETYPLGSFILNLQINKNSSEMEQDDLGFHTTKDALVKYFKNVVFSKIICIIISIILKQILIDFLLMFCIIISKIIWKNKWEVMSKNILKERFIQKLLLTNTKTYCKTLITSIPWQQQKNKSYAQNTKIKNKNEYIQNYTEGKCHLSLVVNGMIS